MLNINILLNVLLLSISIATIIITLISYILFKLRQVTAKAMYKDPIHMEGLFFTRYAPCLEKLNNESRFKMDKLKKKPNYKIKLGALFLIVVLILSSLLLSQSYLLQIMEQRKNMLTIENFKELASQGLLQKYDYEPLFTNSIEAFIPLYDRTLLDFYRKNLNKKKIFIVKPEQDQPDSLASLTRWSLFLQDTGISHTVDYLKNITTADLLILPSIKELSPMEQTIITNSEKFMNIVVSGYTKPLWTEKILKIKYILCPQGKLANILFASDKAPFWSIPMGYISNKFYTNNFYCVSHENGKANENVAAYLSNSTGQLEYSNTHTKEPISKFSLIELQNNRLSWFGFEPYVASQEEIQNASNSITNNSSLSLFYDKLIVLTSIAWTAKIPVLKFSNFPKASNRNVLFAFSSLEKESDYSKYVNLFFQYHIPFTYFGSEIFMPYLKNAIENSDVKNQTFDIGIDFRKSSNTYIPKKVEKIDFQTIENGRMDFEENFGKKVGGLKLNTDVYIENILYAAVQNKINYIYADKESHYVQTYSVNKNRFSIFPISFYNDINPKRSKIYYSKESFETLMDQVVEDTKNIGMPAIFTFREEFNPKKNLLEHYFNTLDKKKYTLYNFETFQTWLNTLMSLDLDLNILESSDFMNYIVIKNNYLSSIKDLTLFIDNPGKNFSVEKDVKFSQEKKVTVTKLNIFNIESDQSLKISVKY